MSKREEARWERRERKYRKRRYGMRVSGRSVKAILLPLIGRKTEEAKMKRYKASIPSHSTRLEVYRQYKQSALTPLDRGKER